MIPKNVLESVGGFYWNYECTTLYKRFKMNGDTQILFISRKTTLY